MPVDDAPRRRPYWLLAVFAVLMLSPPSWATAALITAAVAGTVVGGIRRAAAQRARQAAVASAGDGTVLGADGDGRPAVIRDDQLAAHGLILGASGSGKTTTLLAILTDHIRRGRPVVAIDMKGSPAFAQRLGAAANAAGRPFRLWTLDGPSHWNPLQHGNATELKDKLIATERFSEPHYQRAAERYVQMALLVLAHLAPGRPPTLSEVVDAMDPRRLSSLARGLPDERAARVQDYLAGLTRDQLSAVRGLGTRMAIISESHVGRFMEPPGPRTAAVISDDTAPPGSGDWGGSIDLRSALEGPEVVLFSLNSSTYGRLASQIGTLAIQDLITAVGHRLEADGGVPVPSHRQATIAIDEFSAIGADNVIALIARAREAGSPLLLATQEFADLERAAPGLRDQVTGSTAIKLIHRQDVPASALTVAQMAGTVKRWDETQVLPSMLGARPGARGTRRLVEQFVVHPNEIKTLRTGEVVVIAKTPRASVSKIRVTPPQRAGPSGLDAR
jgi:conjugal transfer pilus assembly protein TraD